MDAHLRVFIKLYSNISHPIEIPIKPRGKPSQKNQSGFTNTQKASKIWLGPFFEKFNMNILCKLYYRKVKYKYR